MVINVKQYESKLNLLDTQIAIKYVKDQFEKEFSKNLHLIRVSAPLFVLSKTGLNDNLNGIEKPVSFINNEINGEIEIVQSLAKWKRSALKKYNFNLYEGLYTDMNAIRKDEKLDNIHSLYVDQRDYEIVINKENRNLKVLFDVVKKVYKSLLKVEIKVNNKFPILSKKLPDKITFVSSNDLVEKYPHLTNKEREYEITKLYGAVFIYGIGWPLVDGVPFDNRAADYDDWNLNGDILVYDKVLDIGLELSSMGIRVDENSIIKQLIYKKETNKIDNSPYVKDILMKNLPYTIGGGIGQSRICLFLLEKAHIGEVQASTWSEKDIKQSKEKNIFLL